MESEFRLFPDQASTVAPTVDALLYYLLGISAFFTVLICVLILFFATRYRRRSKADRTLRPFNPAKLEVTWSLIPLALAMIAFGWGAAVYSELRQPPADAMRIYAVGKQWMWKFQHPSGKREINHLHVPTGQPVRMVLASEDVIHSFFVPAFRTKMDVVPGRYNETWFEATREGEYHLFCAEYCGTGHSRMIGTVHVLTPADYQRWLSEPEEPAPPEEVQLTGAELYERHRCGSCHKAASAERCPSLEGLYGRAVSLADGSRAIADEAYLREAILDPGRRVSAGYPNTMPTYQGQIDEEDVFELIAYIKGLDDSCRTTKAPKAAPGRTSRY